MLEWVKDLLHRIYDVEGILRSAGTWALPVICAIVFAETGLMVGFFLPGDSLLVTAGIFAAHPEEVSLPLWWLLVLVSICAIVGDQVGYLTGRKIGSALYSRPDSLLFKKRHVVKAHEFYERYGAKTIVIARFVPIVRTFAPIVAGVANMNYRVFVTYNIAGGLLWVWSMVLGGYWLGSMLPNVKDHIHVVIVVVVAVSLLPVAVEWWRDRRRRRAAAANP